MKTSKLISIRYLCIALVVLLLLPFGQALAADIMVDADCSLQNAIRSANEEELVEPHVDCEAGDSADGEARTDEETGETVPAGQDTISIDVSGTNEGAITLDATLSVTSDIVIDGNGFSVDGGGNQIFSVTAGSLSIHDLTMSRGFSVTNGGAISVTDAALTLVNSVVSGSGARGLGGGIYALDSDVALVDSVVTGNVTGANAEDYAPVVVEVDETSQTDGDSQTVEGETESTPEPTEVPEEEVAVELPQVEGTSGGGIYFISESSQLVIERSGLDRNVSPESGGGLYIAGGSAAISNSTISGNSAGADGGGIYSSSASILTHVTVVGNSAVGTGGIVDTFLLQLYNSILSDNEGGDCSGSLNANLGNLIKDLSCNHDGLSGDPDLLRLAGSPAYYLPQSGSPAIDAASADYCLPTDQRDIDRLPETCDIGAAEHQAGVFNFQIQSALAALTPIDSGGGEEEEEEEEEEPQATPAPSICESLPSHISVTTVSHNTACKVLDENGVGHALVINGGMVYAVDIFGDVSAPVTACFEYNTGAIILLDAAYSPRIIAPLRTWTESGKQCATVDRAGTAVLMPLTFFTSGAIDEPIWDLTGCTVTTTDILNLRQDHSSSSEILANVLNDVQLNADQRATYHYRVNYYGIVGWLSADYLSLSGTCA